MLRYSDTLFSPIHTSHIHTSIGHTIGWNVDTYTKARHPQDQVCYYQLRNYSLFCNIVVLRILSAYLGFYLVLMILLMPAKRSRSKARAIIQFTRGSHPAGGTWSKSRDQNRNPQPQLILRPLKLGSIVIQKIIISLYVFVPILVPLNILTKVHRIRLASLFLSS